MTHDTTGLDYAKRGEQVATIIPGLAADLPHRGFARAAVIGAGTMGVGIATSLLNAGLPVVLIEQRPEALERGANAIRGIIEANAQRGRITEEQAKARLAGLRPSLELADVAEADIVIEAVFEDLDVKRQVFAALDTLARPDAVLASNTSTLDVDAIAAVVRDPSRVLGMHFFSPAHIMRLLEIVRGAKTAPEVLASVVAFARRIGKVGVVAGVCDGFIGNRIFEEELRQAYYLLEEGCVPRQIDDAMQAFGWAMGPLRVMDLAGGDIGWNIRKRRAIEQPDRPYSAIPDMICEMGRYGQKTGAGYYLYTKEARQGLRDPEIEAMIVAHSRTLGLERREIGAAEIVERLHLAMINEAAKVLEDGIAYRPSDIDVIYVNGYGFPAAKGGLMFQADLIGIPGIVERIRHYRQGYQGWAWEPAPLLLDLAARGATLASLNGQGSCELV
jgi:3-hydroxyacyl-CoA dehydrogenase